MSYGNFVYTGLEFNRATYTTRKIEFSTLISRLRGARFVFVHAFWRQRTWQGIWWLENKDLPNDEPPPSVRQDKSKHLYASVQGVRIIPGIASGIDDAISTSLQFQFSRLISLKFYRKNKIHLTTFPLIMLDVNWEKDKKEVATVSEKWSVVEC